MAHLPNYLEMARVLLRRLHDLEAGDSCTGLRQVLEFAAEEFGIECVHDSKRRKGLTLREDAEGNLRDVGEAQSCLHLCGNHKEVMLPDLWATLPHDMLKLVFVHLPLNDIRSLRCLSSDWEKTIVSGDSDFLRVCDEVHPRIFALVRKKHILEGEIFVNEPGNDLYLVRVFDAKSNAWHTMQIFTGHSEAGYGHLVPRWSGMGCEDGGLVLFYLEAHVRAKPSVLNKMKEFRSFFYTVMNPLTGESRDLPPILGVSDVDMSYIMVNRESNGYKVLLVVQRAGEVEGQRRIDIQVFDSETGQWSQPNEAADVMFGNQSAYDFAQGRWTQRFGEEGLPSEYDKNVECCKFYRDRLFVLHKDTDGPASQIPTSRPSPTHYIKEYAIVYHPQRQPTWVEVEIHRCTPFEHVPKGSNHEFTLLISKGFLVVFSAINELKPYEFQRGWMYDLASRTWHDLPELPGDDGIWMDSDEICEIRWNAHP